MVLSLFALGFIRWRNYLSRTHGTKNSCDDAPDLCPDRWTEESPTMQTLFKIVPGLVDFFLFCLLYDRTGLDNPQACGLVASEIPDPHIPTNPHTPAFYN